jgi:monofunctional biosynthetic peptidoglycan transglycosylase
VRQLVKTALGKAAKWLLILLCLSIVPVLVLRWVPVPGSMMMVERWVQARTDGRPLKLQQQWKAYREIPDHMKMAVIAAEDQNFARHQGFDIAAIRAAIAHNRRGGSLRGASTISQQTAKNVFLWSGRSWLRKGLESWYTLWIELLWPKQRILEVYLNVAEWDDGVFGVEAAAQHHFGLGASYLSARQAATLAAVLPNPRNWSAAQPSAQVQRRARWIQQQMNQLGGPHYLREMEKDREWSRPDWLRLPDVRSWLSDSGSLPEPEHDGMRLFITDRDSRTTALVDPGFTAGDIQTHVRVTQ